MTTISDTEKVEQLLREIDINPDRARQASNIWSFTQGDAAVFIIAGGGFVIIQSTIMGVPKANIMNFYRKLLELNDHVEETLGSAFSIDPHNQVVLKVLRPVAGLSSKDFSFHLTAVAFAAARYIKLLGDKFGHA